MTCFGVHGVSLSNQGLKYRWYFRLIRSSPFNLFGRSVCRLTQFGISYRIRQGIPPLAWPREMPNSNEIKTFIKDNLLKT